MKTPGNNSSDKKVQIIAAFYQCAIRDGLKKATNRKIAQEAGIPLGLIHYYFKDREEMIEGLVEWTAENNIQKYQSAVKDAGTFEERFQKTFEFLFVTMLNDEAGSLYYDLWSEAKRNPNIRKSFTRMYDAYRRQIAAQMHGMGLSRGLDKKQIRDLASILIAMNEGILIQWDIDRRKVVPGSIAGLAGEIFETFFTSKQQ